MEKLKWYVIWYSECNGWAVMKGEFRDSWYQHKYEAEQWCAYLNAKDDMPNVKVRGPRFCGSRWSVGLCHTPQRMKKWET